MRKLPKGYVFTSFINGSLLVGFIFVWGYLSKRINPFILIPIKDWENDAQKCLLSKIKSTMELV